MSTSQKFNRRKFLKMSSVGGAGLVTGSLWTDLLFSHYKERAYNAEAEEKVILTPTPGPRPAINTPAVYGCRPGRPLIFRIPCTGKRPINFNVVNLPSSLKLDAEKGIITGYAPEERRNHSLTLKAENEHGFDRKVFDIVVGDELALTPPMGWNSWYTWYHKITSSKMKQAADQMIASGMADYGYSFVNIDDCWMKMPREGYKERKERLTGLNVNAVVGKARDSEGNILPNSNFPDMKGLTDYIHNKGLKAGIYTSPGPMTCQLFEGSYGHERRDAKSYAEWGFDFLKYDWCTYGEVATGEGRGRAMKPYQKMGDILKSLDRDIIYNLCQYGNEDVWEWGDKVEGHCWRTTGDLGLEKEDRLPGFYSIGMSNAQHWRDAGPGAWNDPDYILIGYVGNPPAAGFSEPQLTSLTPNEQYSYMSMWSLMAAPLFFSGDMERLDEFTMNVLCNIEIIEVNQDRLGQQAKPIKMNEKELIMSKPMADGSLAVGLFNLDESAKPLRVTWQQLGLKRHQRVRDLWRQNDIGKFTEDFKSEVPRHGVVMVRLWPVEN